MPNELPRTRLVVMADALGIEVKTSHVSRGGQVTREFFREVATVIGVPGELAALRDKVGICQLICNYMGIPFDEGAMTSRGARITNRWFDDVMGRFDSLRVVVRGEGADLARSELGRGILAAHRRTEREAPAGLNLGMEATCYCCGDNPGARLNLEILEAHCTLPYATSFGRLPGVKDFVAVCPSCHKVLHLRGVQAKELLRELRP